MHTSNNFKMTFSFAKVSNIAITTLKFVKLPAKRNGLLLCVCVSTFSRVFTNCDSFIFDAYKVGLVHMPLFRYLKICSSMKNFHVEVEQLRSIFKCKWPVDIIGQCIKTFLDKLYVPEQIVPIASKKELIVL